MKVFLSHTSNDKPFVRKIASILDVHGVEYWIDEAEIKVGDSLIGKIRSGIDGCDYLAAFISNESCNSAWVTKELDVAMNLEIAGKSMVVLPIRMDQSEMPGFLFGKFYADFSDNSKFQESAKRLIESLGIVFNPHCFDDEFKGHDLYSATRKTSNFGLPIFRTPLHRPFQYIGMNIQDAAKSLGVEVNEYGNFHVDQQNCKMLAETEGNFISFIQVEILSTSPHKQSQEFDSVPILGAFSINPAELQLISTQTHCHIYSDHKRKIQVSISCDLDDGPLSIAFSAKYYGK